MLPTPAIRRPGATFAHHETRAFAASAKSDPKIEGRNVASSPDHLGRK